MSRLLFRLAATGLASWLILSVSGCSGLPSAQSLDIGPDDRLRLNAPVTFAPDSTRTFIQYGRFTTRQHFERYDPHCRLEKQHLNEAAETLAPGTFDITRLGIDQEQIASRSQPIHLASRTGLNLALVGDDFPPPTMDVIHLYLAGEKTDPPLLRLTCAGSLSNGSPADYPRSLRPDREKINRILGEIGQIVSAASPTE
ncbi:MAG: hypothetical protein RI556_06150 [Hydrogenovibrio sp.]|uniref:hypothetical protein n=1 Tax=Hydrogenovibrio sp. TaxID=2065821 RepID=UPI00286FC716|nr:hypothetical protein [Hydrogenovibrio sp.]MDR9498739.1 hypothetical protein [Hydrogenovibrio sp.]